MNLFLTLAFLFFIGSLAGWLLEVLFRRFLSEVNSEKKWINPGFCTGPYLPLYGCGLCLMYLIASLEKFNFINDPFWEKISLFIIMAICMTAIEYVAGVLSLKTIKVRLWDYSKEKGNIQGIICPRFSLIWALLGALYYFLIHPHILGALNWLSNNLAFSFVIGLFFGIFIMDASSSIQLVAKLKKYAEENEVIVRYEEIKKHIRTRYEKNKQKYDFFHPFRSDIPISEHLKELRDSFEIKKSKIKKR